MKENNDALIIAERIKQIRLQRGWTLTDVSEKTGISIGTLSKLENGKTKLNFTSVNKLANGLGIAVTELTSPQVSLMGRRDITLGGQGVVFKTNDAEYQLLCDAVTGQQQGYLKAIIKSHQFETSTNWHSHNGEEFLYILKGKLELHSKAYEPIILSEGDSILFDASINHQYVSISDQDVECLISFSLRGYKNAAESIKDQIE